MNCSLCLLVISYQANVFLAFQDQTDCVPTLKVSCFGLAIRHLCMERRCSRIKTRFRTKRRYRTTRDRCERDIETVSCWELTADAWELTCWSDGATSAVGQLAPSYRRPEEIRQGNRLANYIRHGAHEKRPLSESRPKRSRSIFASDAPGWIVGTQERNHVI
jgi:hypothetical protein